MSQNLSKEQIGSFADSIVEVVGAVSGENNKLAALDNAVKEVLSNAIQKAQEVVKTKLAGLNVYEVVAICDELESRKRDEFEKEYKEHPGVLKDSGPMIQVNEEELREALSAPLPDFTVEDQNVEKKETGRGKRGKLKRV